MNKRIALAAALTALLYSNTPAFSQYIEPEVITDNTLLVQAVEDGQEKLIVKIDDVPYYEVMTRSYADTVKLFWIFRNFDEKTLRMMGIKWFKARLISDPDVDPDQFYINTYYDSDSAIQFAPKLSYFRSKNREFVKSVTNVDLLGMSANDMFAQFGEGIRTPAGKGYRYMHSIKDISGNGTNERFYFYTEDAVVTEVAYERHDAAPYSSAMMSFWGYQSVPEGWLTKGECTGKNVKVYDSVPNGEVIGKFGGPGQDNEVMVLEIATTGDKFNWVKIVAKNGLTGWVYGKYIRPGLIGTSYEQTLNNSIEYCEWLAGTLGSPNSITENTDQNGRRASVTKVYDNHKVEYMLPGAGSEEVFFSIEYTAPGEGHKNRFCGIGIGDDIDAANAFAANMQKADAVPYERGQEFFHNSMLKWVTVDQKAEIIVGTTDGYVSCIIIRKIIN